MGRGARGGRYSDASDDAQFFVTRFLSSRALTVVCWRVSVSHTAFRQSRRLASLSSSLLPNPHHLRSLVRRHALCGGGSRCVAWPVISPGLYPG